jgi:hypothetical protein
MLTYAVAFLAGLLVGLLHERYDRMRRRRVVHAALNHARNKRREREERLRRLRHVR